MTAEKGTSSGKKSQIISEGGVAEPENEIMLRIS